MGKFISFIAGLTLSIPGQVYADIPASAKKLTDPSNHQQAVLELIELAKTDHQAFIPLLEYVCGTDVDDNTMTALDKVTFIRKQMMASLEGLRISGSALSAMVKIMLDCTGRNNRWYYVPEMVVAKAAELQPLTDTEIDRITRLAVTRLDQYNQSMENRRQINILHYLQIFTAQGKHKLLPEAALRFAEDTRRSESIRIFANQLAFGDRRSEIILFRLIESKHDSHFRKAALQSLSNYFQGTTRLNEFTRRILGLYDTEKDSGMKKVYYDQLTVIAAYPGLDPALRKTVYNLADKRVQNRLDVTLLKQYKQKLENAELSPVEIENVLQVFKGNPGDTEIGYALGLFSGLADKYGLTRELHEILLLEYVGNPRLWGHMQGKTLIVNAIPYRNIKLDNGPLQYSDGFIQQILTTILANIGRVPVSGLTGVINNIANTHTFSPQNIDVLYAIFARQDTYETKRQLLKILLSPNVTRIYVKPDMLYADLKNWYPYTERELYPFVVQVMSAETDELQVYYRIYNDQLISHHVRGLVLQRIIESDFDNAARKLLPPVGEELKFEELIWGGFLTACQTHHKQIDRKILQAATKHESQRIRFMAWKMLEMQGEHIPLRARLEDRREREIFLFNAGALVLLFSLIAGTALALLPQRHRKIKRTWMLVTKVILWVVSLSTAILFSAVVYLLGGLSHSGYPYGYVYPTFFYSACGYLLVCLLLRYVFPTVRTDMQSG